LLGIGGRERRIFVPASHHTCFAGAVKGSLFSLSSFMLLLLLELLKETGGGMASAAFLASIWPG